MNRETKTGRIKRMNELIDSFLSQAGIHGNSRPAIRDGMRFISEISAREEVRAMIAQLATCPVGTLVSDVSLSLAHGLTPCANGTPGNGTVNSEKRSSISEGT